MPTDLQAGGLAWVLTNSRTLRDEASTAMTDADLCLRFVGTSHPGHNDRKVAEFTRYFLACRQWTATADDLMFEAMQFSKAIEAAHGSMMDFPPQVMRPMDRAAALYEVLDSCRHAAKRAAPSDLAETIIQATEAGFGEGPAS